MSYFVSLLGIHMLIHADEDLNSVICTLYFQLMVPQIQALLFTIVIGTDLANPLMNFAVAFCLSFIYHRCHL
jgi:hypothetical protein